ncbi:MAG: hypothetical protein WD757_02045 [Actinomycetota bacterium]
MAIKGKKRTRSRRPKPAAPKQAIVVPKKRFLSRRWVQVCIASLVTLALGLGFGYGFGKQSETTGQAEIKATERKVATAYRDQIEQALKGIVTQDPSTGDVVTFPELSSAVDGLKRPGSNAKTAKIATESASQAKVAAKEISEIDLADLVGTDAGLPAAFTAPLFESQGDMSNAIEIYKEAAINLKRAVQSEGSARSGFAASARRLSELGSDAFADGYEDYISMQIEAGIYRPPVSPQQQLQQQVQQQVASPPPAP